MKFTFYGEDLSAVPVDVLAIPVLEDAGEPSVPLAALDAALDGALTTAAKQEGFKGRSDQTFPVPTFGRVKPRKVVLYGIGKSARFDLSTARELAARAARAAVRFRSIGIVVPDFERIGGTEGRAAAERRAALVQALATGARIGIYRFDKYRTKDVDPVLLRAVTFCLPAPLGKVEASALQQRSHRGEVIGDAVCFARDLVNEPAITLTPRALAEHARTIARQGKIHCKIYGKGEIEKMKMGCLLGVSAGSAEEPRFIHMTYKPARGGSRQVALVGKGLTFDSGGLSLKPAKSMEDMKTDMAGAAAVLGAMRVVAALKPHVTVHGVIATTENMPGGRAIRPGDVLKSMSGKTIEVLNTDAEGRLVLADALHYIRGQKVDEIVDLATLTGACMVALGRTTAGYFSNDPQWAEQYRQAAKRAGEDAWQLPLVERLADGLRSPIADLKNIGDTYGGAITAALFLREFVGDTPWVHVDIAGPAFVDGKPPAAGATGYGVMTLAELLLERKG